MGSKFISFSIVAFLISSFNIITAIAAESVLTRGNNSPIICKCNQANGQTSINYINNVTNVTKYNNGVPFSEYKKILNENEKLKETKQKLEKQLESGNKDKVLKEKAEKCIKREDYNCAEETLLEVRKIRNERTEQDKKERAESALMLANLKEIQLDDSNARKFYEEAYFIDPDNVDILFDFGTFLSQDDPNKSKILLEGALQKYRDLSLTNAKYAPWVARTLNNLSNVLDPGSKEKQKIILDEALKINRILAQENKEGNSHLSCDFIVNIGTVEAELNDNIAEEHLIEAKKLVQNNKLDWGDMVFGINTNLGDYYLKHGNFIKAEPLILESIKLGRSSCVTNSKLYPVVGIALLQSGGILLVS